MEESEGSDRTLSGVMRDEIREQVEFLEGGRESGDGLIIRMEGVVAEGEKGMRETFKDRAISCLHSSSSTPIYHRDIKSLNILLDERHKAKFTDKSDVYSFGVVLLELLTSKKPIYRVESSMEQRNFLTKFSSLIEQFALSTILDHEVVREAKEDELMAFVELATRCINWSKN
ncbi:hypothetical protein V2J09_007753 [Rumex salicifolius]